MRKAVAFHGVAGQWSQVRELLRNEVVYSLEVLEHDLDEEPQAPPDELSKIKQQLDELFTLVKESKLSPKLRSWLMTWLSALRQGIDRYQISGAKGLQDALIRIQGEAVFFVQALKKVKDDAPTVFERLNECRDFVSKACDIAERLRKLFADNPAALNVAAVSLNLLTNSSPLAPPS